VLHVETNKSHFDYSWLLVIFLILLLPATVGIFAVADADLFNPKESQVAYERGKIENKKLAAENEAEMRVRQAEADAEIARIQENLEQEKRMNAIAANHAETRATIQRQIYWMRGLIIQITITLVILTLFIAIGIRIAKAPSPSKESNKLWTDDYIEKRVKEARQNEIDYRIRRMARDQPEHLNAIALAETYEDFETQTENVDERVAFLSC
jgi:hypothetical protein